MTAEPTTEAGRALRCRVCGRPAYRPDPVTTRRPALRCGGCHRMVGGCRCARIPEPTFDRARLASIAKAILRASHMHARPGRPDVAANDADKMLAAIEQEARADERRRIAEEVRELPVRVGPGGPLVLDRAAVLAIIERQP